MKTKVLSIEQRIAMTPKSKYVDRVKKLTEQLASAQRDLGLKEADEKKRAEWVRKAKNMIVRFYPVSVDKIEQSLIATFSVASMNKLSTEHELAGFTEISVQ
jgi:hypothetical protein